MDYSQSKQTTKQWHYCQEEAEERVSSQYATKLTCSNNRANRGYRPNHDVAPCRIGSLTIANTVNNGWENEPVAAHRQETHVSLKENRNRIPKRKIISCLTCQSLFHFSRAMFSLDNERVKVRVFLFANNLQPDPKASSLPRVNTFSHRNIVEVDRILNEQSDLMLFRAREARWVDERLDSDSVAQRPTLIIRCHSTQAKTAGK